MAYTLKYAVFFAFAAIGLWVYMILPGDFGAIPGAGLILAGLFLGQLVFLQLDLPSDRVEDPTDSFN